MPLPWNRRESEDRSESWLSMVPIVNCVVSDAPADPDDGRREPMLVAPHDGRGEERASRERRQRERGEETDVEAEGSDRTVPVQR